MGLLRGALIIGIIIGGGRGGILLRIVLIAEALLGGRLLRLRLDGVVGGAEVGGGDALVPLRGLLKPRHEVPREGGEDVEGSNRLLNHLARAGGGCLLALRVGALEGLQVVPERLDGLVDDRLVRVGAVHVHRVRIAEGNVSKGVDRLLGASLLLRGLEALAGRDLLHEG